MFYHNRLILFANGPRGSYRKALGGKDRTAYSHQLQLGFKLGRAMGYVEKNVFGYENDSIDFKVGWNLSVAKKIRLELDELRKKGVISRIEYGRIFYPEKTTASDSSQTLDSLMETVFERLMSIRRFGETNRDRARERFFSPKIRQIFTPDSSKVRLLKTRHFLSSWGIYDLLLDSVAKDMVAGKELLQHKMAEAGRVGIEFPAHRLERYRKMMKNEARLKDIAEIKYKLQADNHDEIPVFKPANGGKLPQYTFVISDVHLREFRHENTDGLLRFIWMVKRLDGRLIVNGDFFDVWRAGGLQKCLINNTRIINALTKLKEVIFITGNHDEFLEKLARRGGIFVNPRFKVVPQYRSSDSRIRICHGHQSDRFNRPGSWIGRWATSLITKMEMAWAKNILRALNAVTAGAFSLLYHLLNFVTGPQLSARLLLLPRLLLPTEYILKRQAKNILDWLAAEVEKATNEGLQLKESEPLVFIIGHIHYEGLSYFTEKIKEAVSRKYGRKVRLVVTDSWEGGEGYSGDFVSLTPVPDPPAMPTPGPVCPRVIVRKEIWTSLPERKDNK